MAILIFQMARKLVFDAREEGMTETLWTRRIDFELTIARMSCTRCSKKRFVPVSAKRAALTRIDSVSLGQAFWCLPTRPTSTGVWTRRRSERYATRQISRVYRDDD